MGETSDRQVKLKGIKKSLGFTLIEIMIVVAVIGILSMVTVPKYQGLIDYYHLESSAQMVAGKLRNAKQYAMDRRTKVYVMLNPSSVEIFYKNDENENTPLETQQSFDIGVNFNKDSSSGLDPILSEDESLPDSYNTQDNGCLIFDRKGFLEESEVSIVLTNNRSIPVSVDLNSETLEVKITSRQDLIN